MILTIDMGNTQIEIGGFEGSRFIFSERLETNLNKTEFEYAALIRDIFSLLSVPIGKTEGAIISSVVPPLTSVLKRAVQKAVGVTPLIVGPGLHNGLIIRIDDPKQLGADLVVNAVGALHEYGAPLIIIDYGTASTISVIDAEKRFLGGLILPGVRPSYEALVRDTSQLPKIPMEAPPHIIGSNTVDCMKSGLVYGQAAMLDGVIARIQKDLKISAGVVITGGLAGLIVPYCDTKMIHDKELMLKGLRIIYDMNADRKSSVSGVQSTKRGPGVHGT